MKIKPKHADYLPIEEDISIREIAFFWSEMIDFFLSPKTKRVDIEYSPVFRDLLLKLATDKEKKISPELLLRRDQLKTYKKTEDLFLEIPDILTSDDDVPGIFTTAKQLIVEKRIDGHIIVGFFKENSIEIYPKGNGVLIFSRSICEWILGRQKISILSLS